MNTLPPHDTHNARLAAEWFEQRKLSPFEPPVSAQVETLPIDRKKLSQFGYNPSIIRQGNRLLMAYRWHKTRTPSTVLSVAEIGEKGKIVSNSEITIGARSAEDPRLFLFRDEVWMAWVESNWVPGKMPTCLVKYGRLVNRDGWKVEQVSRPEYGKNDGSAMVKNLVIWSNGQDILCIYASSPEQIILNLKAEKVVEEWKTPGPCWPWGSVKGGTTPMLYRGKLLRFFHSTLDNEPRPWRRRYYVGAMLMEPKPPFEVVAVSSKPIIRGSELCDVNPKEAQWFKGNVVFPAGCLPTKDGRWMLSLGVNDCQCTVAVINPENLNL